MERETVFKIVLSAFFVIPLAFLLSPIFFPHPIDHCCSYQNNSLINTNTSSYYDPVWKDWVLYDPIWGDWVRTDDENQYCFFSSLGNFKRGFRNSDNDTKTGQWTKLDNTTYLIQIDNLTNETIFYNASIDLCNTSSGIYRHLQPRRDDEKRYIPP